MTILPKKKHQDRKGEDHDNESRNRTRNRNAREGRTIASNRSSPDDLSDNNNSISSSQQMYDDIDRRDSQETQCLPLKRVRHSRQTGSSYHHSSSSLNPKLHRNTKNRINDKSKQLQHDYKEEDIDGYNSSDEYDVRTSSAPSNPTEVPAESITEMENNFEHALRERKGFIIKQMATDGACLFRAVADQVYGDQEMHGVVRRHCMDYMMKNRDFFSPYVTEDFNSYIRRKRNEHSHGNNIEMQALSEMYNRPIEVYQYTVEPINTFHSRTSNKDDTAPIRLSYHGNVHYNSVIDPYSPTVGVGLGLAGYKPGTEDKHKLNAVIKESEAMLLEQEMLEDKLKATDWEATDEDVAEIAARESYLQWLNDNQKSASSMRAEQSGASSSKCTSTKSRRSPPRESVGTRRSPPRTENNNNNNSNSRHSSSPRENSYERSSANLPSSSKNNLSDLSGAACVASTKTETVADPWGFSMMTNSEWNDDPVLAAVLAQSQQEYIDNLKANSSKSKTTDTGGGSKDADC